MRKNPVSRSGFFGSHVFFGLAIVLTGISLALVGFGRSAHETMQSPRRLAAYQFATDAPGLRPPSPSSALSKRVTTPLVFTVINTNDTGTGSLRQSIMDANGMGGGTIAFNIPGTGVHTISPLSQLPTISQSVTIDGYTQPGSSLNTNPPTMGLNTVLKIELNGSQAGNAVGLLLNASNCTVRGLVIDSFQNNAIVTNPIGCPSNGNLIEGNFLGTDPTGTIAHPNNSMNVGQGCVILCASSSNNTIGGTTPDARNLISGNIGEGISYAVFCLKKKNKIIGIDVTGTYTIGNM